MSENNNDQYNQNQQDDFNIEDIIKKQNTSTNKTTGEEVRPSSVHNAGENNPYLVNNEHPHHHHHHHHHHKKCSVWQKVTWIILAVLLVAGCAVLFMIKQLPMKYRLAGMVCLAAIAIATALYSLRKYHRKGRRTVVIINVVLILLFVAAGGTSAYAYKEVRDLRSQAAQMKTDLGTVMTDIHNEDINGAQAALVSVNDDNTAIKNSMNHPLMKAAARLPKVGSQVQSVNLITNVVDEASSKVLTPLITQMSKQPLSQLKVGDSGFNVKLMNSYLDFLNQIEPTLSDMNDKIQKLDLSMTGEQDTVNEYKHTFQTIMDGCNKYMPVFRTVLGDGSDRNFLFVAQNLAEGRTNGGFPGSAGIISISNGVLNIGDFEKIYDLIPSPTAPADAAQTDDEVALFDNKMVNDWDANYTPDFARAGQIWCRSYEDQNGVTLNGVISLTPSVIQDALKEFNTSITLSDGTILDGTNAAKIMGYDLYYKYLGGNSEYYTSTGNDITDALFSETASKAKEILMNNFSLSNLNKYTELLNKSMKDGTFLVWMKDPEDENTAIKAGISGILTDGKTQNGNTGFYWSFDSACKMGWFMDLNSDVSEPVENGDGKTTYTVTVTMKNNITDADIQNGSNYILGRYNGNLQGQLHLTAPLGGSISDVKVDNTTDVPMTEGTYEGLQIFYNNETIVQPGQTMTVSYKVTLPAGVKKLNFCITPSYRNYR